MAGQDSPSLSGSFMKVREKWGRPCLSQEVEPRILRDPRGSKMHQVAWKHRGNITVNPEDIPIPPKLVSLLKQKYRSFTPGGFASKVAIDTVLENKEGSGGEGWQRLKCAPCRQHEAFSQVGAGK